MSNKIALVCSGCWQNRHDMRIQTKDGKCYCRKCAAKTYVKHRPKCMNWRKAISNLIKFGTFTP